MGTLALSKFRSEFRVLSSKLAFFSFSLSLSSLLLLLSLMLHSGRWTQTSVALWMDVLHPWHGFDPPNHRPGPLTVELELHCAYIRGWSISTPPQIPLNTTDMEKTPPTLGVLHVSEPQRAISLSNMSKPLDTHRLCEHFSPTTKILDVPTWIFQHCSYVCS